MKRKKVICITMDEKIWIEAKKKAKQENRTLSNFLSNLVVKEQGPYVTIE